MIITIEVTEKHDDVMSITLIGNNGKSVDVTTAAFNLEKGTHIVVDEVGKCKQVKCNDKYN